MVDCVWNVMAHAQKPDFVFRQNGRVHLIPRGRQFSRLLAGELCTPACRVCTARAGLCSAVMWRLLVTHSILLFPLHFSRASPCAITFQLDSTAEYPLPAHLTQTTTIRFNAPISEYQNINPVALLKIPRPAAPKPSKSWRLGASRSLLILLTT